jgi:hypothetical protein
MKAKLASLLLFTSIISVTQSCYAGHGKTKHTPSIQESETTLFGSVVAKNEWSDGFTSIQKSVGGSKLVSALWDN